MASARQTRAPVQRPRTKQNPPGENLSKSAHKWKAQRNNFVNSLPKCTSNQRPAASPEKRRAIKIMKTHPLYTRISAVSIRACSRLPLVIILSAMIWLRIEAQSVHLPAAAFTANCMLRIEKRETKKPGGFHTGLRTRFCCQ